MRVRGGSPRSWRAGSTWSVRCGPSAPLRLTTTAQDYFWTGRMPSFQQEELMRAIEQRTGIWRLSLEQIDSCGSSRTRSGAGESDWSLFQSADFYVSG